MNAEARFGGKGESKCYNDTWIFHVLENTWTEAPVKGDTPAPRQGHSACVMDYFIYIFGGETFDGIVLDDLYAFNTICIIPVLQIGLLTVAQRWVSLNDQISARGKPTPRWGHTMSTFDKSIILLGGTSDDPDDNLEEVFVLDTSQFEFPPEYTPTLRYDSFRSVASEPPLQQIPFSSDPRFGTWSGAASQSPTPATPSHSPARHFSIPVPSTQSLPFRYRTYESDARCNELVSPLSVVPQRQSSILRSETLNLGPTTLGRQEPATPAPLSIDPGFQLTSSSQSPSLSLSAAVAPVPMHDSHSAVSAWLNNS